MLDRRSFIGSTAGLLASTAIAQPAVAAAALTLPAHFRIENTAKARMNAEAVERQKALLNEGKLAEGILYFAPDTRNHGRPVGREGVLRVLTDIYTTFPDWFSETQDLIASGDDVIVRSITTGTHRGVGKLPVNRDDVGMMQQLGLLPASPPFGGP